MSVCPHTERDDKCTCHPGCGCDRDPLVIPPLEDSAAWGDPLGLLWKD
jgi:hypothetical protein